MKNILVLLCLLVSSTFIFSQNSDWKNYSDIPNVSSIAFENNFVWIGTNSGLIKFDKTTGENFFYDTTNSKLPGNLITSIAIDKAGNKWIGVSTEWNSSSYAGGGLAKFDGKIWTVYNTSNSGLPDNLVTSIAIDGNENKWIGTNKGLAKFDENNSKETSWTIYNSSNSGLPFNTINSIAIDGSGNKWIGTNGGGLAKFDSTNWNVYNASNSGLPDDGITAITIDGSGSKWIGTDEGLVKFDETNWTIYNSSNSELPDDDVTSIAVDESSNIWVGTKGGLVKFDGTNWNTFNSSNSNLPYNSVVSIFIDGDGSKWIGTEGSLAVYKQSGDVPSEEKSNTELPKTNASNLNTNIMYFCEKYDDQLGEIGISDRFTKGSITVMVKSDNALGLSNCYIQFDKYNISSNTFKYYKKFNYTIEPDMKYVYFDKNEDSDLSFDEPGFYRVFLLDDNNNTIASTLIEIID